MFYTNEERRRRKRKHLFSGDRLFPVFKLNARICSHPTLNRLKRALSRSKVDTCASSFNFPYFEESIMCLALDWYIVLEKIITVRPHKLRPSWQNFETNVKINQSEIEIINMNCMNMNKQRLFTSRERKSTNPSLI